MVKIKPMPIARHFTATGFVVHYDQVALHWHPKVQAWLPPGGHIEMDEDPVQAVLREIREESGIEAEVVLTGPRFDLDYPAQVAPPLTILIEDIDDPVAGHHKHIDMIYVCRLVGRSQPLKTGWMWVARDALAACKPLRRGDGFEAMPPEDVRLLALHAFNVVDSLKS